MPRLPIIFPIPSATTRIVEKGYNGSYRRFSMSIDYSRSEPGRNMRSIVATELEA